jgi:hypothetical protein
MAQGKSHNSNLVLKYHPLKGKQIKNKNTGKVYSIEKVIGQFFRGWYITLLLEQNGSHDQVIWKNVNSKEDWIPEEIQENQEIYEIIS